MSTKEKNKNVHPDKNKNQQPEQQRRDNKHHKMANIPEESDQIDTDPTAGSASSGKQVTSGLGRTRTSIPHSKTFITGTDEDGQVS